VLFSLIVYGADATKAQQFFEDWCQRSQRSGEAPIQTEIKKIVGAALIDKILGESEAEPLDWAQIEQRLVASLGAVDEAANGDEELTPQDEGEGFWVDVEHTVPAKSATLDLESLKAGLPEEIRSALNWSPDKRFLFLLSALAPVPVPTPQYEEFDELESGNAEDQQERQGDSGPDLDDSIGLLPHMREKDAAALIEARNSVVATWLWRKFAAGTALESKEILVTPCCGITSAE
jgi:hypothetical protein